MRAIPRTLQRKGEKYEGFIPACSSSEIWDGTLGFCVSCGEETDGVEPDARRYTCDSCGKDTVYGLEQLVMMNMVELDDEGSEA